MWMDTKYEPGTVKVVAYDKDGKAVAEKEIHTAGKAHHIVLTADRENYKADGKDLAFVRVSVVDKDGNLVPDAENDIRFSVSGAGSYHASANGNSASTESFQAPHMKAFHGELTTIVRTDTKPGNITLKATAPGLKAATLTLKTE